MKAQKRCCAQQKQPRGAGESALAASKTPRYAGANFSNGGAGSIQRIGAWRR